MRRHREGSVVPTEAEIESAVGDLSQAVCVVADSGRFYEEVTELLRAHAIVRLVVDADAEGFSNDLTMSAHARRAYLRQCTQPAQTDAPPARCCAGAFFDALASGDLALAAELASLAPTEWRPDDGPEEDFLWQRGLELLLIGAPRTTLEAHLEHFSERLADTRDPRLAVFRALCVADATAFARAFRRLLHRREIKNAEAHGPGSTDAYALLEAQLYLEGIAVLKLARALEIPIEREYPMCPAVALLQDARKGGRSDRGQ